MNTKLRNTLTLIPVIIIIAFLAGILSAPVCADTPRFCNVLPAGTPVTDIPVDRDEIKVVTPEFELLPLSAFTVEEGVALNEWMQDHVIELIPRPGGYQVTVRWDDGTNERRFFTEFSNGQPFPSPPPGSHGWAYTLTDEEIQAAMEFYGEEDLTWGDFLERVAPQELDVMDDTIRAKLYEMKWVWPDMGWIDQVVSGEELWTMQVSHSASMMIFQEADAQELLPDLSDVPVGVRTIRGPNWELKVEVRDEDFGSMAELYRVRYPGLWASFSDEVKKELATKPPRIGFVTMSRTMNESQEEVVREIWGSDMTNEEYYSLVWPDMWAAMPIWKKESMWADEPYYWESSEDYVDLSWNGQSAGISPETKVNVQSALSVPASSGIPGPTTSLTEGLSDPDSVAFLLASVQSDTTMSDLIGNRVVPWPHSEPNRIPILTPPTDSPTNETVILTPTPTPTRTPAQSIPYQNTSNPYWHDTPILDGRHIYGYVHPPYEHIPLITPTDSSHNEPVTNYTLPIPTPISSLPANIPAPSLVLSSDPVPVATPSQSLFPHLISRISSSPVTVPTPTQSGSSSAFLNSIPDRI